MVFQSGTPPVTPASSANPLSPPVCRSSFALAYGRAAILRGYAQVVKLAPDVDLQLRAQRTSGFVGADLANGLNKATVLAVRSQQVERRDFEEAIARVIAGLEKKNRLMTPRER